MTREPEAGPLGTGVYLPGSWPCDGYLVAPDEATATTVEPLMREQLSLAGKGLVCLGDGEPWRGYVMYLSKSLRDEPGIRVVRDGNWSGLADRPVLARRRPWSRLPQLDRHLRYARFAQRSLPVLRKLQGEHDRSDLPLLAGIPSPLNVSVVVFGLAGPLFYRRAIHRATVREITRIRELGEDVVVQLELPAETVAVATVPRLLQRFAARWAAASVCRLARAVPSGTRMAIHLCLGSLNGRPARELTDLTPLVRLANALSRNWPAGRRLEVIHLPLTTVSAPARTDPGYYAPLTDLELSAGTQLAAGLVVSVQDGPGQLQAASLARAAIPSRIRLCIAPPCGLLSETPHGARLVARRAAELAHELDAGGHGTVVIGATP
ncbi:MAG TPA: hypothetical protein VGS19_01320 [Streptosporangiaceae bacterium]|nr:hypothetical protein [Streptosporangiaceae bacterium]